MEQGHRVSIIIKAIAIIVAIGGIVVGIWAGATYTVTRESSYAYLQREAFNVFLMVGVWFVQAFAAFWIYVVGVVVGLLADISAGIYENTRSIEKLARSMNKSRN